jgi:hypothetical protein
LSHLFSQASSLRAVPGLAQSEQQNTTKLKETKNMKNRLVVVPPIAKLIRLSPGFAKKELSDFKLDLLALCGFGCTYWARGERHGKSDSFVKRLVENLLHGHADRRR